MQHRPSIQIYEWQSRVDSMRLERSSMLAVSTVLFHKTMDDALPDNHSTLPPPKALVMHPPDFN